MVNKMEKFFEFIDNSKSVYHTVAEVARVLEANGYEKLSESDTWSLRAGGKYYVVRDGSSVIAFRNNGGKFVIAASHSDSPAFLVKCDSAGGAYVKLDTEKYGGLIHYTWMDKPLTVAGRAVVSVGGRLETRAVDIGERRVVIPSLAIHLNRTVNDGCKLSPASDLIPLASLSSSGTRLSDIIAESAGVEKGDVVSHQLYLVNAAPAISVGYDNELVLAPRLDDLACVYASLQAFISGTSEENTPVLAIFDNEEVGSETKQGAASTFLYDTLSRIAKDDYRERIAGSFMVSADNAHAIHPNHPELADKNNAPTLGGGIVIKHNANQRYTTEAVSEAIFKTACNAANVKTQSYFNRPDQPGGSTLGSISDTKVSLHTVDIGIPQLAMHSATECCAVSDILDMEKALAALFAHLPEVFEG